MKILVIAASALVTLLVSAEPAQDKPDPRDFGPDRVDVSGAKDQIADPGSDLSAIGA